MAVIVARAQGPDTTYPAVALEQTRSSMASTRSAQTGTATAGITLLFLLTMLMGDRDLPSRPAAETYVADHSIGSWTSEHVLPRRGSLGESGPRLWVVNSWFISF